MLVELGADVKQRLAGATELFAGDALVQFLPQYTLTLLQQVQVIPAESQIRALLNNHCLSLLFANHINRQYVFRKSDHFLLYYLSCYSAIYSRCQHGAK